MVFSLRNENNSSKRLTSWKFSQRIPEVIKYIMLINDSFIHSLHTHARANTLHTHAHIYNIYNTHVYIYIYIYI